MNLEKQIIYNKEALKFLNKINPGIKKVLLFNIERISQGLNREKCRKLIGLANKDHIKPGTYRLKLEHFRILFRIEGNNLYIDSIVTKTNAKFRKYGTH